MGTFSKVATLTACIIVVGVLSCSTARAEVVDRIVANVNGEIILYSELQEQVKLMEKFTPNLDLTDPVKRGQAEREVLNELIRQKLTEEEVQRLKVAVTSSEVDSTLARILEQNHATQEQFEISLKANGQTLEKFRERIRKDMERTRLMERVLKVKVSISDEQLDAFLNGEAGQAAATLRRIRLGLIALPVGDKNGSPEEVQKKGREILGKLKAGADFSSMAKQFSKGPAAQEGGDIGYMTAEELAPFISKAVSGLKKDDMSDLVQGPGGYYILKVLDIDVKKVSSSDQAFREKARTYLYNQEVNRKFEEWVRDLESKAFIQISL